MATLRVRCPGLPRIAWLTALLFGITLGSWEKGKALILQTRMRRLVRVSLDIKPPEALRVRPTARVLRSLTPLLITSMVLVRSLSAAGISECLNSWSHAQRYFCGRDC